MPPTSGHPDVTVERDVPAEMRDGTILYADVYRPAGDGPWPVLLMRLPYGKTQAQMLPGMYHHPTWYARRGYLVAIQDTRGRHASEGEFDPFRHEEADGYDAVEWAADLEGSNGRVGMYGFSYVGATQLQAAVRDPPSLECVAPALTAPDFHDGWAYRGGAFALAFNVSWARFLAIDTARRRKDSTAAAAQIAAMMGAEYGHLPLEEFPGFEDLAPYFYDWVDHEDRDAFWRDRSVVSRYDEMDVPGLHVAGWYDVFLGGTLRNFVRMREATDRPQRLLVYPWWHMPWSSAVGEVEFGDAAGRSVDEVHAAWFDRWLADDPDEPPSPDDRPTVTAFVMGADAWREADKWPPADADPERWYLHSDGTANGGGEDGRLDRERPGDETPDVYVYDPLNPIPSRGGRSCCVPEIAPMGPADQSPNYARKDLLVYTSSVLGEPIEVTGPVSATLHVESSAPDTDFVATLVDVHPDGRAINVAEGITRVRYRDSLAEPTPLEPGTTAEIEIDLAATGTLFREGHRIGLSIASSDYPQYDRHPNVAGDLRAVDYVDYTPATQTVYHDDARPSHVTLPVVRPPVTG